MAGIGQFVTVPFHERLNAFMKVMDNQGVGNLVVNEVIELGVITSATRAFCQFQFREHVCITQIKAYEKADLGTEILKLGVDIGVNGRPIMPYGVKMSGAASGSTTLTVATYVPLADINGSDNAQQPMWFVPVSNGLGTFDVGVTNFTGGSTTNLVLALSGYRLAPEWLRLNT